MPLDFQYDHLILSRSELRPVHVRKREVGYELPIGYPNYRGTFLSCIESLTLELDGVPVNETNIRLGLNGKEFLIEDLSELCHEYWFVREPMTLRVFQDGGLIRGKHTVRVTMTHRIPYTGYFGQYLTINSVCEKQLSFVEGERNNE